MARHEEITADSVLFVPGLQMFTRLDGSTIFGRLSGQSHRLYLDGDEGFNETGSPVVYFDAYQGWVREVPGTFGQSVSGQWYISESVRTGYRIDR